MPDQEPQFITVGTGDDSRQIAVLHDDGQRPGVLWLGGFKSDMIGTKAQALVDWAKETGRACTRMDYSGHGYSGGKFADGTISRWLEESLAVFNQFCRGPTVVIGSSMGGWMALLLARAHLMAKANVDGRLHAMVLIAPAPDFTEELMWKNFSDDIKNQIETQGYYEEPSEYSDEPYVITKKLIDDGRANLLFGAPIETGCPVHILQGAQDPDVPWQHAQELVARLAHDDVVMTLVKDGDHRLSRPQDIDRMVRIVGDMAASG